MAGTSPAMATSGRDADEVDVHGGDIGSARKCCQAEPGLEIGRVPPADFATLIRATGCGFRDRPSALGRARPSPAAAAAALATGNGSGTVTDCARIRHWFPAVLFASSARNRFRTS